MKLFVKNKKGLKLPEQAHVGEDVGYDIECVEEPIIVGEFIERPLDGMRVYKNVAYIEYKTNLFVKPEDKTTHVEIYPRSSVTSKNLILKNSLGLIDPNYLGEILIRFAYTFQPEDYVCINEAGISKIYGIINQDKIYHTGQKIAQIVAQKSNQIEFEVVGDLGKTTRDIGGFGSSDKK
jgi:dUTPase